MIEKYANYGSDFEKIDAHVIQPEEYDELPELTEEMLDRAVIKRNGKTVCRYRDRYPKEPISIRLDADIVAAFRESGPGWQSRINTILREHMPPNQN